MSPRTLQAAADDCFVEATEHVQTLEAHRAAIEIWNAILEQAIAAAMAAKTQFIDQGRYNEAAVAMNMARYFEAMKATADAPFRGTT